MNTPWGKSQGSETICRGMAMHYTASHGGLKLSPALNNIIPDWLKEITHHKQGFDGWYEHDCDWCIPVLFFQQECLEFEKRLGKTGLMDEVKRLFNNYMVPKLTPLMTGDRVTTPGLYLSLYHGRSDVTENLDHWGSPGPLFGPLQAIQVTYLGQIRLDFCQQIDALRYGLDSHYPELKAVEDCIAYRDVFYGDWSVSNYTSGR